MDYTFSTKWILFILVISTAGIIKPATSQLSILNTPPVMYVDRNWRISETEEIGSVIARVRAEDAENDHLLFDLEPLYHGNYASTNNNEGTTNDKLPFRIDSHSGIVYLNESLSGRGGENFFLYITVYDGQLTAKNEVYVNILSKNNNKFYNKPSINQQQQQSHQTNMSQFFPPFYSLPGVQSIRNHPNNPRQQPTASEIFNGSQPPRSSDKNLYPNYSSLPINPPLNSRPPFTSSNNPSTDDVDDDNNRDNDNDGEIDNGGVGGRVGWPTRTKLKPIKLNDNEKISTNTTNDINNNNITNIIDSDKSINRNQEDRIHESEDVIPILSVKAFIPVIITICGICLAASLIGLVIYRKRLCAIGKSLKKKSKEEMAKKSNQSNLSNITDDSRNSMVLQHWNGPMAFNNRYVPWERDNQQSSMATSQLSTSCTNGGGNNGITTDCDGNGSNGNGSYTGNSQMKTDQWEFPRHRLKFFNILGEGAFGQVWRCEATDIDGNEGITTVAVKTLKENATEVERNDLYTELQVMKSLEPHVNVVRLLGCCTDKDPIFVIIEYVNRGKLQTYLRNSRAERHYGNTHGKSNILTSGDLTSFMYQVAKGMDYLTSRGIIHRDLAARNILITDDHTCKVADFGFARDIVTSKIYERKSEGKLPIRWMATESLYDNIFSVKSDIWSFGILMWEIVTLGSTPYPGISAADVMRKVRDGYRLEKPEHCRRELYNIMFYCWADDSNERPSFSEVVLMLDKLLHTEMDYIELERFPDHNYYNILNLSGEKV